MTTFKVECDLNWSNTDELLFKRELEYNNYDYNKAFETYCNFYTPTNFRGLYIICKNQIIEYMKNCPGEF